MHIFNWIVSRESNIFQYSICKYTALVTYRDWRWRVVQINKQCHIDVRCVRAREGGWDIFSGRMTLERSDWKGGRGPARCNNEQRAPCVCDCAWIFDICIVFESFPPQNRAMGEGGRGLRSWPCGMNEDEDISLMFRIAVGTLQYFIFEAFRQGPLLCNSLRLCVACTTSACPFLSNRLVNCVNYVKFNVCVNKYTYTPNAVCRLNCVQLGHYLLSVNA